MKSAPFTRLFDKICFIFGVLCVMTTCYLLGASPDAGYYVWHAILVNVLVIYRIKMYYDLKYHYYLFDFCYFANVVFSYFLMKDPTSKRLFYISFMWSTGPLALAIGAFRNSLVFHSVDHLTSLTIHVIPLLSAWNMHWGTA